MTTQVTNSKKYENLDNEISSLKAQYAKLLSRVENTSETQSSEQNGQT